MNKKFTTDKILKKAFTSFKENSKYFLILGSIYSGLIFSLGYLFETIEPEKFIFVFILNILLSLIYAKLAIMVHRTVLLQESDLTKIFLWTVTELKFALMLAGLYLGVFMTIGIVAAFIIPFTAGDVETTSSFVSILIPFFLLLGFIIVSRVSLVFPAIAIKKNMKFSDSWKQSKGYVFSLFVLLILIPLLRVGRDSYGIRQKYR